MMEKVEIDHPIHEHHLILSENEERVDCYGCGNPIGKREWVYVCVKEKQCSSSGIIFHRRCGELPTPFSHSSHPHHPLHLVDFHQQKHHQCNLCFRGLGRELGYQCSRCDFNLDITCKELGRNGLLGEPRQLQNPCHIHPLTLMRKPPFVFNCDACGTEDRDMVCMCSACEFLIHKACALLPPFLTTNHHHHQLSLSSRFPFHHRNFEYQCDVCEGDFNLSYWVYFCGGCKFFAHLKCATSEHQSNLDKDGSTVITFPLEECDVSKELITPFVIRANRLKKIPNVDDMPRSITASNAKESHSSLFNYHIHTLSLISELSSPEVDSDDDDDDDDDDDEKIKICDVCVTPISSPLYYECASCKYFIHSICYLLTETSISPLESRLYGHCRTKNHDFTVSTQWKTSSFSRCYICGLRTSEMVYLCRKCQMVIDVKCACLPTTIGHASHPRHSLVKTRVAEIEKFRHKCRGCGSYINEKIEYLCTSNDCDYAICPECILLPKSIKCREWDKHPLPLTYDANIDHPTDFYCGICEDLMHPKAWMYYCKTCDNPFHPACLKMDNV